MIAREEPSLEELTAAIEGASEDAISEVLASGGSIFYRDSGMDVREDADGQRFEIEYDPAQLGAYRIKRALPARLA